MTKADKSITVGPRYTLLGGTPWTIPNIGTPIDNMASAYQAYINRKNGLEGKSAIKDFRTAAQDFVTKVPPLYEYLYSHLPVAAPPINRDMRKQLEVTLNWDLFHARWLTLMQLCQHWSAREELTDVTKKILKIELLYEMYKICNELIELSEIAPTDPEKGLL